jgi:hypothetical protein
MTTIHAISNELTAQKIDFSGSELLRFVRANYRAYCPKCGSTLIYSERSAEDYLGACIECDEDFYSIECYLEES